MKKIFLLIILSNLIVPFANAANDFYDSSSSNLTDRISRLEKDLIILQKQYYRNKPSPAPSGSSSNTESSPNNEVRFADLEDHIRKLNGKFEELEHGIIKFQEQINKLSEDVEFRFRELELAAKKAEEQKKEQKDMHIEVKKPSSAKSEVSLKESTNSTLEESIEVTLGDNKPKSKVLGTVKLEDAKETKPAPKADTKAKDSKNSDQLKVEYDKAYNLLTTSKLEEAENKFLKFTDKHKDSKYTGSAFYWLGEINNTKKNHEIAAKNYLQSYKTNPEGPKAPDALLKLGTTLMKLKKTKDACAIFLRLKSEYPNASDKIKDKTQSEMTKAKCQ